MQTCTKCNQNKSINSYYFRNKAKGILHKQCKKCYQEHRITYYKDHYKKYKKDYLERARDRREKLRNEYRINLTQYLEGKSCEICGEEGKLGNCGGWLIATRCEEHEDIQL